MGALKPSSKPAAIAQMDSLVQMAQIKADEEARQKRIKEGRAAIDKTFDAKFSPEYFKNYGDAYTGYYFPQLQDKFAKAKQDLVYKLSGQGIGASTVAVDRLRDADKDYNQKRLQVSSEATDAVNNLRSTVEKQRSNLYAMNEAAADPSAATNRATAEATAIAAPVSYSPLGDIFAGLASGLGGFAQGMQSNQNGPWHTSKWPWSSGGSGSMSVTGR